VSPWLGVAVAVALIVVAVWRLRGGPSEPPPVQRVERADVDDTLRILVIANETATPTHGDTQLAATIRAAAAIVMNTSRNADASSLNGLRMPARTLHQPALRSMQAGRSRQHGPDTLGRYNR
jgi:hypothetical protein